MRGMTTTEGSEPVRDLRQSGMSAHERAVVRLEEAIEHARLAVRAFKVEARPKPMSAEERVDRILRDGKDSGWDLYRFGPMLREHFREAEGAAWDRALDAQYARFAAHYGNLLYDPSVDLKGKCHEVQP